MAKQPLPDPPPPILHQPVWAKPTAIHSGRLKTEIAPVSGTLRPFQTQQTSNFGPKTENWRKLERKKKSDDYLICHFYSCVEKKTSITSMDPCSCFHGFLHLWELPCFVSQTRSYCPLWTRHPRDLPQLGFPSIVVVTLITCIQKINRFYIYLSFVLIKRA